MMLGEVVQHLHCQSVVIDFPLIFLLEMINRSAAKGQCKVPSFSVTIQADFSDPCFFSLDPSKKS